LLPWRIYFGCGTSQRAWAKTTASRKFRVRLSLSFLVVTAVRGLLGAKPELEAAPKIIDTILLSNYPFPLCSTELGAKLADSSPLFCQSEEVGVGASREPGVDARGCAEHSGATPADPDRRAARAKWLRLYRDVLEP
jgi:hypothetical protein